MTNKEKIDYLLIDLRELENLIGSMKEVDFYPASFFNQSFQLTHKIFTELHSLEDLQIKTLRQQMEEHQRLIDSLQQAHPIADPGIESKKEDMKVETIETVDSETIGEEEDTIETSTETEEKVVPELAEVVSKPVEVIAEPEPTKVIEEEKEKLAPATETTPHPTENQPKTILADKTSVSLNDILERKNLSDFRKAFSLNDRFRFRRELFGGNEEKMNQAINALNDITSYEGSVEYLYNELKWNIEDESVADFLKLLEKRFS